MDTLADDAIAVRDAIRALMGDAETRQQIAKVEDLALEVGRKADQTKHWAHVSLAFDPNSPPVADLPRLDDVRGLLDLAESTELSTSRSLLPIVRRLGDFSNQLTGAELALRQETAQRVLTLDARIRDNANTAKSALRTDLASTLLGIAQELQEVVRQNAPSIERINVLLGRVIECQTELQVTFQAGSDASQAFIRAVVTGGGVPLSKLSSAVLDELKGLGLADSLVVRSE